MLAPAVAGVDDGTSPPPRPARGALLMVPDDHVGVAGDDADGVLECLPLEALENSLALSVPITRPPRRSIAASKERRVRVEGS